MRAKNAKGAANAWASEGGRAAAEDERGASLVIRRCTKRIGRQAREVTRTRNKAFCASAKKPTGQGGGRDTLPWLWWPIQKTDYFQFWRWIDGMNRQFPCWM